MNSHLLKSFILLLTLFLLSCEADVELNKISNKISIDPSLVMPFGGVSLNLGDIIAANDSQKVLSNTLSEVTYQRIDSMLFSYPKIDLTKDAITMVRTIWLSPTGSVTYSPDTAIPTITTRQDFDLGINQTIAKERIDSTKIRFAILSIRVNTTGLNLSPSKLKFNLTFADGKMRMLDGSSSVKSFVPTGFNKWDEVYVSNFVIITSGGANSIPLEIKLDASTSTSAIILNQSSKIDLEFKFTFLDWQVLYGKFDMSNLISTTQQIPVGLNTNLLDGLFKFSNPQIDISAVSNIGMKLGFKVNYFKSYSTSDTVYALFDNKRNFTQEFTQRPTIPGNTVTLNFKTFDKDWGTTDKLIEKKPSFFEYNIAAYSNSSTDPTASYIIPNSEVKVYMKTTIPMQFNAGSYYLYKDTIDNVFGNAVRHLTDKALQNIDTASLVFTITNKLPVKTMLTIRFLTSMGVEVKLSDTFNKTYEIASAKVDTDGRVISSTQNQQLVISLTKDELVQLKEANVLEFQFKVEGEDINSKTYFSKSNTLEVKLGLFIKTKLSQ